MKTFLANNCVPKFKKQSQYWIEDRNGKQISPIFLRLEYAKIALRTAKKRDHMSGIMSRVLLSEIIPKSPKVFRGSRHEITSIPLQFQQRSMQGHMNYVYDMSVENEPLNFRSYNHQNRMQRQQANKQ